MHQLNNIFQLTLPVFLIILPTALTLVLALICGFIFGPVGTQIGYAIFSSYAFMNSLFTITFVTPYREDARAKIRFLHLDRICCWVFKSKERKVTLGNREFSVRTANKTPVSHFSSSQHANSIHVPQAVDPTRDGPIQAF